MSPLNSHSYDLSTAHGSKQTQNALTPITMFEIDIIEFKFHQQDNHIACGIWTNEFLYMIPAKSQDTSSINN